MNFFPELEAAAEELRGDENLAAGDLHRHLARHLTESLGVEFERMCRTGNVTPDMWMKTATGDPVGPQALLRATQRALEQLGGL